MKLEPVHPPIFAGRRPTLTGISQSDDGEVWVYQFTSGRRREWTFQIWTTCKGGIYFTYTRYDEKAHVYEAWAGKHGDPAQDRHLGLVAEPLPWPPTDQPPESIE